MTRDVVFGNGSALERPAQKDFATSGRDQTGSLSSSSGEVCGARHSEQAAHAQSGVCDNKSDGLYPWLSRWRLEEFGDISVQHINRRCPGFECKLNGRKCRGIAILFGCTINVLDKSFCCTTRVTAKSVKKCLY